MDEIICQQCGHANPIDAVFCQRCGRLLPPSRPATDQLTPTLRAGEEPQRKSTAELEQLLPAWLREMHKGEEHPPAPREEKPAPPPSSPQPPATPETDEEEIPDWLKELGILSPKPAASAQAVSSGEKKEEKREEATVPPEREWGDLGQLIAPGSVTNAFETGPSAGAEPEAETPPMLFTGELPAWLKGEAESTPPSTEEPTPDWLKAFAEEPPAPAAPAQPATPPAKETPAPAQPSQPSAPPAIIGAPGSTGEDLGSLLEMEVPDWLAEISAEATSSTPGAEETPALETAELPAWVQAMRPIEAIIGGKTEGGAAEEEEKEGPLAGLRGVLPRAPETLPYTRPRPYSVRLNVTPAHQAHVQLLEQLIAAESQPRPRQIPPAPKTRRFGYWLIAILLLSAILLSLFARTQITTMPELTPQETWQFIESLNALPPSPKVLLVLDFEMATSGEMEALLLPPLRHLTSIKQAHLAFIALNPLISTMNQRLLDELQVAQSQMPLPDSLNLGYLPGGISALPLFASNPTFATSVETRSRWQTSAFQGVRTLSDFDCVILVTDNAENARIWIEQTSSWEYSLLIVSSARSAPMLSPYFYSGQVKGMIAGLNAAASYEQITGLIGLARRYRDAYSAGLLLALGIGGIGALLGLLLHRNSQLQEGA